MTILAAFLMLLATVAFFAAIAEHDRANALQQWQDEHHEAACALRSRLDDAQREAARYRTSNAHLIREATTLGIDLYRTEQDAVYLRSCLRRQRDCAAGAILLGRQVIVVGKLP
jgi:hypothetical protein